MPQVGRDDADLADFPLRAGDLAAVLAVGRDPALLLPLPALGAATGFSFGVSAARGGASPSTPLSGQTLTTGHLAQPTAMAMGQTFMGFLGVVRRQAFQYGPARRQNPGATSL